MPHCITLHTAYYLHVTGTFQSLCKSCPITVTNDMTEEHSVTKDACFDQRLNYT